MANEVFQWPHHVLTEAARAAAGRQLVRDPDGERFVLVLHPESRLWLGRICKSSRKGICWNDAPALVKEQLRQYVKIVDAARGYVRPMPYGRRLHQAWRDYQERERAKP